MTQDKNLIALHNFKYEVRQFMATWVLFLDEKEAGARKSAFLESCLVHARVLVDFFSGRKIRDDVSCVDYGYDIKNLITIKKRKEINKYLFHLSYERKSNDIEWMEESRLNNFLQKILVECRKFCEHTSDQLDMTDIMIEFDNFLFPSIE